MLPFLLVCTWAVHLSGLPVLAESEANWRKSTITLSAAARVNLAHGALSVSVAALPKVDAYSETIYHEMAQFDLLTGQSIYSDALKQSIAAETRSFQTSPNIEDWLVLGHAAITAARAYNDSTFMAFATTAWTFVRSYTISAADVSSGSMKGKDFPLAPECQGASLLGGTFDTVDTTDHSVNGFTAGYFLLLSASLAEATSDATYQNAAVDSLNFISTHLTTQNVVQSAISTGGADACMLDAATISQNTGLVIEALAILVSTTKDAALQAQLETMVSATLTYGPWISADGIIVLAGSDLGDMYIVRALAEAYMRNITSAAVRTLIHDFLGVQFNAVVDLATSNGNNIYGGAWTGPPSATYAPENQTLAIGALLAGVALNGSDPVSGGGPSASGPGSQSQSTAGAEPAHSNSVSGQGSEGKNTAGIGAAPTFGATSPSTSTSPTSRKPATIAGAILGILAVAALAAILWVISRRRRARSAETITPYSQTFSGSEMSYPSSYPRRHPQLPAMSGSIPTAEALGSVATAPMDSTAVEPQQLPTHELLRLLNDRLRSEPLWHADEAPPEYGPRSARESIQTAGNLGVLASNRQHLRRTSAGNQRGSAEKEPEICNTL